MPNKPAAFDDPFKKIKSGSHSKYGGARFGLIHSEAQPTWNCQCCGEEQPQALPGFLLEFALGEYARICAKCFQMSKTVSYSYHRTVTIVRLEHR